jgi:hypothetical protein
MARYALRRIHKHGFFIICKVVAFIGALSHAAAAVNAKLLIAHYRKPAGCNYAHHSSPFHQAPAEENGICAAYDQTFRDQGRYADSAFLAGKYALLPLWRQCESADSAVVNRKQALI